MENPFKNIQNKKERIQLLKDNAIDEQIEQIKTIAPNIAIIEE